MTQSPLLTGADSAVVYFDRQRARKVGAWTTVVKNGDQVEIREHRCQADANAYLGLEGGSPDPYHRPAQGPGMVRAA